MSFINHQDWSLPEKYNLNKIKKALNMGSCFLSPRGERIEVRGIMRFALYEIFKSQLVPDLMSKNHMAISAERNVDRK
jgi:hypothetical protein